MRHLIWISGGGDDTFEDEISSDSTVIPQESARPTSLPKYDNGHEKYHMLRSKEIVPVPA